MALRGPETSSFETTVHDVALAREIGVRMTMHVGVLGLAKARAVTRMAEAKLLGPDITHVHATRCTDDELRLIAESGGTISSAAYTELMSAHGLPSLQRFLRFGLEPSLSVDNETRMPPDLFAPMRALVCADHTLESQRAEREGGQPTLVPMRDVLKYATLAGARATGLDAKIGSLTPGKRADIVLIDLDGLSMYPVYDPVAAVVLFAQARDVSWVFVDGVIRKREGGLVSTDLVVLRSRAVAAQRRLLADAGIPFEHPV
jgi:cytosine/adenosine deaminase-related metal-dependent hydrolase